MALLNFRKTGRINGLAKAVKAPKSAAFVVVLANITRANSPAGVCKKM